MIAYRTIGRPRTSLHAVSGASCILEGKAGDHRFLVERLTEAGRGKFKIVAEPVALLDQYKDPDKLAVFLSNFDSVILANVAADQVNEDQQEVLRSNTHDQGCGLVIIGGPDSFGAGGWQNTPVEKACRWTRRSSRCKYSARADWCSSCTLRRWPMAICGKKKSRNSP